ncbi:winged helix-turn-helix domain-containing protein [Luteimonas sp. R10]|uniref:winged helix-turn-helix domain-containing protein n=1 Tax=Luteimonas sp. R10 TaxID=3108176 RepID=UPI00388D99CE
MQTPLPPHRPASSDCMRIGDGLVVVSTREIQMPGARRPQRVTPKAMAVLCMLADNPGKVVSRNALLAEVWPGTLPTDDVLTQAVTQLRKAFGAGAGEAAGGKRYIETIAKNGYRLMAAVERLDDGETGRNASDGPPLSPAEPVPAPVIASDASRPRVTRRVFVAGVTVLALAMVSGTFMLMHAARAPAAAVSDPAHGVGAPARPYRLITSAPGFELFPALSPDASMVAYAATVPGRRGTVIQVQTTSSAQPRRLSEPPAADVSDSRPAWSPDGREIAFARTEGNGRCRVVIVAANGGGAEREVARCDHNGLLSFDWTPDGHGLVFGTMTGADPSPGIRVLELATGRWRELDYDVREDDFDYAPRYSPDGKWIAFVRNPQLGDLWRMPAAGGKPEPLTDLGTEIRGWSWLPDSRSILFGRRVDSQSRLYRLDVDSGRVNDLGLDDAQSPAVSASTGMLAFVHRRPQFGIYRVGPPPSPDAPVTKKRLFESSGRDTQPTISPDGRQLVFTSDRSGRFELWHVDLSRPQSLRPLEGVRPETRQAPAWSADSRKLLVAGWDERDRASIYEVFPGTGQATRLPVPPGRPLQAVYLPDPTQLLVVAETGDGDMRLILFDRSRTPWRTLRVIEGVSQARYDPVNRRVLFTRLSGDGLWQADPGLRPESVRQIDASAPARWRYRTWAVGADGAVGYLHHTPDCSARMTRIAAGPGARATYCLASDRLGSTNGLSIGARTGAMYVALAAEDGTDIGFMPLPERRPGFLLGIAKWMSALKKSTS